MIKIDEEKIESISIDFNEMLAPNTMNIRQFSSA